MAIGEAAAVGAAAGEEAADVGVMGAAGSTAIGDMERSARERLASGAACVMEDVTTVVGKTSGMAMSVLAVAMLMMSVLVIRLRLSVLVLLTPQQSIRLLPERHHQRREATTQAVEQGK